MTVGVFKNCLKWMQKNLEWQCHAKGHDCPKAAGGADPSSDGRPPGRLSSTRVGDVKSSSTRVEGVSRHMDTPPAQAHVSRLPKTDAGSAHRSCQRCCL